MKAAPLGMLTPQALRAWLDRLASEARLIAPRTLDGLVLYRPVTSSAEITLDYTRPKLSAKEAVLPSTEHLLSIEMQGQDVALGEAQPGQQVLFGLRPCDAHGIAVLDAIFIDKQPADSAYAQRRQATRLIGLACPQMWEGCFCTHMGGAPDDASHLDVLLTQVEGGYAVTVVTEQGQALVAGLELTQIAIETSDREKIEIETRDRELASSPSPLSIAWPEHFNDRYWELLAERCIGCRICAYVCPTCRCFDVRDEVAERRTGYSRYDRLRGWDSCTGSNYRVTAGGHNPRATKGQRLRNRFMCKFYYVPHEYGPAGCVGCGRCIEACPVNIDIVEVLNDVAQHET